MISYKQTKDGVMLRSSTRGKVELDSIESRVDPAGPKTFDYKVAKPYRSHVFKDQPAVPKTITTTDGKVITVVMPSIRQVMELFQDGDLEKTIRPFTQLKILEAAQAASLNSRQYGDILAVVSAAEARETYSMIRNVFVTGFNLLMSFYKNAKKLNLSGAIDNVSDAWLQYRYGWRPFIGEVKALHELITRDRTVKIHSSYGGSRFLIPDLIDVKTFDIKDGNTTYTFKAEIHSTDAVVKVGYNYINNENSRNDSLLAQLGLDSEQILATAWEMIPFSFVVDFVFNIGDLLSESQHRDEIKAFNHYISTILQHRLRVTCVAVLSGMAVRDTFADMPSHLRSKFDPTSPQHSSAYWDNLNKVLSDQFISLASKQRFGQMRDILDNSRKAGTNWMFAIAYRSFDEWLAEVFKCYPWNQTTHPGRYSWRVEGYHAKRPDLGIIHQRIGRDMTYCDPSNGWAFLRSMFKLVPPSLVVKQYESIDKIFRDNVDIKYKPPSSAPIYSIKEGSRYSSLGHLESELRARHWVLYEGGHIPDPSAYADYKYVSFGQLLTDGEAESLNPDDLPSIDIPMSTFSRQIENPGNYTGLTIDTDLSIGQMTDLAVLAKKVIINKFK